MVRDFLAAGLVDHAHIVVVPILLGRGVRLWDGLEGLEKEYQVQATSSPSGVTHVTFTRTVSLNRLGRYSPRASGANGTAAHAIVPPPRSAARAHDPHVRSRASVR